MAEETRRDRRVKIVSLNVRYKSATVDEFIENHSNDVSRGGIFVKTTHPFAAGTLLKFEIRLADDKSVMAGVGRVVWRREAGEATPDSPAGMGVKFIKLEDESKAVIERIVKREDAGKGFDAHAADAVPALQVTDSVSIPPAPKAASIPAVAPVGPPPARKQTSFGLGAVRLDGTPPPPVMVSQPPRAATGRESDPGPPAPPKAPMFAGIAGADEESKNEPTVMRQAAEFLEEALKEAGGKIDDFGTNPVFSGSPAHPLAPTAGADRGRSSSDSRRPGPIIEPETIADSPQAHSARRSDRPDPAGSGLRAALESAVPLSAGPGSPKRTPVPAAPPSTSGVRLDVAPKRGGPGIAIALLLAAVIGGAAFYFKGSWMPSSPEEPVRTNAPPRPTARPEPPPAVAPPAPAVTAAAAAAAESPAPSAAPSANAAPSINALVGRGVPSPSGAALPPTPPTAPDAPKGAKVAVPSTPSPAAPAAPAAAPPVVAPVKAPTTPVAAPAKAATPPEAPKVSPPAPPKAQPPKADKPKPAAPDTDNPY